VATDTHGNVYVVGSTFGALGGPNKGVTDAWVIKFDGQGRRLWKRQPGTRNGDGAFGVATDADGNVYIVGESDGALGGPNKGGVDAWVIKFDGDGRELWSRQPGTRADDLARGVATHKDGNVYVVGQTLGALGGPNKGGVDAWVIKFDGDGRELWSRQPGTSDFDLANNVATDTDGNISVVGGTYGALGGANKGNDDAWVIKYGK
jgi:Beta-propeller repeat